MQYYFRSREDWGANCGGVVVRIVILPDRPSITYRNLFNEDAEIKIATTAKTFTAKDLFELSHFIERYPFKGYWIRDVSKAWDENTGRFGIKDYKPNQ